MRILSELYKTIAHPERRLLTVAETAALLGVSSSWIRRHSEELSVVKIGRLIRFDSSLLLRQFQGKQSAGNRLRPERRIMGPRRYQRGYIYKVGRRIKVWYGMWREDVKKLDGGIVRRQRNVRLGSLSELPTRASAYEALSRHMGQMMPSVEMKVSELVERWNVAVVPTIKSTTAAYYQKELNVHIVPAFGHKEISTIGRYDVETFLAEKAQIYCRNTLRGMRVSFGRVLSWAVSCGWLEKNPCAGVRLPHAGTKVKRTVLKPSQTIAIANKLSEPYSTLVLFLAITGLRIGEAIAIKWTDFDGDVLNVSRRIYEGKQDTTKTEESKRSLPIPQLLLARMRLLGDGDWVFRSRSETPVNPGNMLKRHIRPVVKELGIEIGGWHDFRHTLATRSLKRWPTKVVSEILGHSDVVTTMKIYQHVEPEEFRAPLNELASELLCDVTKSA
jgi:integrase